MSVREIMTKMLELRHELGDAIAMEMHEIASMEKLDQIVFDQGGGTYMRGALLLGVNDSINWATYTRVTFSLGLLAGSGLNMLDGYPVRTFDGEL